MLVATPPVRSRGAGPSRRRAYLPLLASAALAASFLSACFLGEEDPSDPPAPIALTPCVDVPEAVRAQADGLVADGNRKMTDNFEYWFNRSDSWWEAKARSPQAAMTKYEQALRLAPGHCQAVFGRAMASATMLTQDTRMDEFIRKVEAADMEDEDSIGGGTVVEASRAARPISFATLFRTPPEEAAPMLVKLSADLKQVDPPTIKEVQELIEDVIMPKLDSTIAALEVIMDYRMFAIRFDKDGDTVEIDRGEIGPGLAGLKVAKAWLTVVAGYNLDITPDGNYDWVRTLKGLDQEDFDHLTAEQTAALDHVTGLFKTGSPFTRMKPAWKERINGIPALLLSAVGDAQKGLESVIEEAKSGDPQTYDVWRAGDGEDDDVDTADLRGAIDLLERSKKYLNGEVPVDYDRGSKTLKVNFTRLFHIDGAQGLLPHFKFYPYAQWNDTLDADTSWGSYLTYEVWGELLAKSGYDPKLLEGSDYSFEDGSWYLSMRDSLVYDTGVVFGTYTVAARFLEARVWAYNPVFGSSTNSTVRLATFTTDSASPCEFGFARVNKAQFGASGSLVLTPDAGQGDFTLSGCREVDGTAQYVEWVEAETKGPLYFTDAAGNSTLTTQEFDAIDGPSDLKGRVLFPDPTFGGIFPGQTNDSFWETVTHLENSPGDRVKRVCQDVIDEDGFTRWECTRTLPSNPSDLDYLIYYLDWWDNGF